MYTNHIKPYGEYLTTGQLFSSRHFKNHLTPVVCIKYIWMNTTI